MRTKTRVNSSAVHLLAAVSGLLLAAAVNAQTVINPPYVYYGGQVASVEYQQFYGLVPTGRELDIRRLESSPTLQAGSIMSESTTNTYVYGAARSNYYHGIALIVNRGSGLTNGGYVRIEADEGSTGPNIAHKTALRCAGTTGWGCWHYQEAVGPHVQAVRWISADSPQVRSGVNSYSIPNIDVFGDDLDVSNAVLQWNVSEKSTGDFLRIFNPPSKGGMALRITKDGQLIINGIPLDQYILSIARR